MFVFPGVVIRAETSKQDSFDLLRRRLHIHPQSTIPAVLEYRYNQIYVAGWFGFRSTTPSNIYRKSHSANRTTPRPRTRNTHVILNVTSGSWQVGLDAYRQRKSVFTRELLYEEKSISLSISTEPFIVFSYRIVAVSHNIKIFPSMRLHAKDDDHFIFEIMRIKHETGEIYSSPQMIELLARRAINVVDVAAHGDRYRKSTTGSNRYYR